MWAEEEHLKLQRKLNRRRPLLNEEEGKILNQKAPGESFVTKERHCRNPCCTSQEGVSLQKRNIDWSKLLLGNARRSGKLTGAGWGGETSSEKLSTE